MSRMLRQTLLAVGVGMTLVFTNALAQNELTTSFTYQGHVEQNGIEVNGSTDMIFALFDAAVGGTQLGSPIHFDGTTFPPVPVTAGNFTVSLDYGAAAFNGDRRWLEIQARHPAGSGTYELLAPRQELTGVPYALQTRGLFVDDQNRVGLGTTSPSWPLDVAAPQGVIRVTTTNSATGSALELRNQFYSPSSLGSINFNDPEGTNPGQINFTRNLHMEFRVGSLTALSLDPTGAAFSNNSPYKEQATIRAFNSDPDFGMCGYFLNNSGFATAHFENDGSGQILWLDHEGEGDFIVAIKAGDTKFRVDNNGTTSTKVLRILGGSDFSETFHVRAGDVPMEPGMTLSIDPREEGRLRVSREAYDHRVAGIVSGAGGIRPGMMMGQEGSVASGEHPVALSGRVYCWVDASFGPVEPGDLLTTSPHAGHAMKATDMTRAQGAILGKAMGRLESGTGLVLVLVGLQ